MLTKRA
jgi:hypothetical protein